MTVTVDSFGTKIRVSLPAPHWTGRVETSSGIRLLALFSGVRSGRRFALSHSAWMRKDGSQEGEVYCELDDNGYLELCCRVGTEPVAVQEVEV